MKNSRLTGFRLLSVGGRAKHKTLAVIALLLVLALAGGLIFAAKSNSVKTSALAHLHERGVSTSELKEVIVKPALKNSLMFSGEWTIAIGYHDDPDVYYIYLYRDNAITYSGVAGGTAVGSLLRPKHAEHSST